MKNKLTTVILLLLSFAASAQFGQGWSSGGGSTTINNLNPDGNNYHTSGTFDPNLGQLLLNSSNGAPSITITGFPSGADTNLFSGNLTNTFGSIEHNGNNHAFNINSLSSFRLRMSPNFSGFQISGIEYAPTYALHGLRTANNQHILAYDDGEITLSVSSLIGAGTSEIKLEPGGNNYIQTSGAFTIQSLASDIRLGGVDPATTETVKMLVRDEATGKILKQDVPTGGGGTADGVVSNVTLTGTDLNFTGANGGFNGSVPLASLQDGTGTDSQTLTFTGSTLSISGGNAVTLPSGGTGDNWGTDVINHAVGSNSSGDGTVASPLVVPQNLDNSPTNEIQTVDVFSLSGTNLNLSLSSDGEPNKVVDLSPLVAAQTLSTVGQVLTISGGNTVNLDNNQALFYVQEAIITGATLVSNVNSAIATTDITSGGVRLVKVMTNITIQSDAVAGNIIEISLDLPQASVSVGMEAFATSLLTNFTLGNEAGDTHIPYLSTYSPPVGTGPARVLLRFPVVSTFNTDYRLQGTYWFQRSN